MNILRIAMNDLRRMFKDKMALFWTLVMPLGFIFFFGQMMKAPREVNTWIPVFNHDNHELSQIFIDQLKKQGYNINVRKPEDEKHIKGWSRTLIIPATFSAGLLEGNRVHVSFVKGEGNSENTLSAQTRILRNVIKFTGALASVDVVKNRWTKLTKEQFLEELNKSQPLEVVNAKHSALRPPPYGYALQLPGNLVMFTLMMSIMFGAVTLAMERTHKQLIRIIAAPLHPVEIFLGKLLGRTTLPFLQAALILLCGYFLFDVPLGDHPLVLFPVILCFALFCGSLGLLFGCIFSTEQQISSVGILFTMLFCAMGGCMWPLEVAPDFFQDIARWVPTHWALTGLHDVMSFGKSWSGVMPECLSLLAGTGILLAICVPLFERRKRTG